MSIPFPFHFHSVSIPFEVDSVAALLLRHGSHLGVGQLPDELRAVAAELAHRLSGPQQGHLTCSAACAAVDGAYALQFELGEAQQRLHHCRAHHRSLSDQLEQ